jgi:hypothetical protein
MAEKTFAGKGRKRPLLNIRVEQLFLDPENPRLPVDVQGKPEEDIINALYKYFDTDEVAYSMAENGYFDEEPLVAVPQILPEEFKEIESEKLSKNENYLAYLSNPETRFTVLEGNRRLSTIKLLISPSLRTKLKVRTFPDISDEIKDDICLLPVIVYPKRQEVLPYLGVRHISGIKKWEPYAKARYIANMIEKGYTIDAIQKQVGDRSNSARKFYLCYQLLEVAKLEFSLETNKAENFFSYLILASGQGSIKDYLGLSKRIENIDLENPVPASKLQNLKNVFSWLFGEGREKLPVVRESRDITDKLSPVLRNVKATEYLAMTRDLNEAYERSDGDEELLKKYLTRANSLLEKSLGFVSRSKSDEISEEVSRLKDNLKSIETLIKA